MSNPEPRVAMQGDTVHIHYTGRLDDTTVFDSSEGREPLQFEIGSGQVIAGFDAGVRGMAVGEKKTIRMPADQAYGERDPERVMMVSRDQFPDELEAQIGMQVQIGLPSGGALPATIVEVTADTVTLDANHQLAGEALTFDIELVKLDMEGEGEEKK